MASQISHIVYAKKFFEAIESGKFSEDRTETEKVKSPTMRINRDEFIMGCVFPDIRRIDENIKRKDTHQHFENIDLNFTGLTSFEAGWKFHLYCDMRREEILNRYDFYSQKHAADIYNHPAKLYEDELLYGGYNNWEKIVNYFNNLPPVETGIGVPDETFHLWYAVLAKYMEKYPDERSMRIFLRKQTKLSQESEQIIESIKELRKNEKIPEILKKVAEEIV